MAESKIGFNEAKKLVEASEGSAPQKGKSFADAAASGIGPKKAAPTSTITPAIQKRQDKTSLVPLFLRLSKPRL